MVMAGKGAVALIYLLVEKGLSHEAIYKVFIRSKGFHSEAMETTCTKNYSGKLASQDNFCAFCLCRNSGKTF